MRGPRRTAGGGAVGLAALTTGALVVPAVATAAVSPDTDAGTAIADRVTRIEDTLAGLVTDGTLDQQQADAVAQRLAEEGFGGHGRGHGPGPGPGPGPGHRGGFGLRGSLDTAGETVGRSEDELRDALADGDTLAAVAQQQGVEVTALVATPVADARERLAEAVTEGRLTQAQADGVAARLPERVRTLVEDGGPSRRGHHHGRSGGDDESDDAPPEPPAPSVEGSATSTAVPGDGQVVAL